MAGRKYFVHTILLLITFIGVSVRLFFYHKFRYIPISDPVTFYDSAKTIAEKGNLLSSSYNGYVAFQPYLSGYNNILGLAMRLMPNPWLATIFLNTSFDILSALTICIFLKKILKKTSLLPMIAFGVWMLNPMNIIFSVLSLPIVIVNFFVILSIYISYLLIKNAIHLRTKSVIVLSVIFGLTLGFGNCFRPIFIVPIIALAILYTIMFLTTNKSAKFMKLSILSIFLSSLIIVGLQVANIAFVSKQTGLEAAKNPSGWSMYVGSSWESSGDWRTYHNDDLNRICYKTLAVNDFDGCHADLKREAIGHYKSYGVLMSTSLFIQKLYHQSEEQSYYYNAEQSIVGYNTSNTFKIVGIYSTLYVITLFILSAKFLYILAKQSASGMVVNPILMYIVLLMIGWFFSFMFVQSAPRYSTILYPIFIIFSVLMLKSNDLID